MKLNRILLIVLFLVVVLLVTILLIWIKQPGRVPSQDLPVPTITLVPTPTPRPTDLFVESSLPAQNPKEPYLTIQKITLNFSEEVNPIDLVYEIDPPTQTIIRSGLSKKTVYIIPREKWEIGTTTITISTLTRSTTGKLLYSPYIYKLVTDIPPAPELDLVHP